MSLSKPRLKEKSHLASRVKSSSYFAPCRVLSHPRTNMETGAEFTSELPRAAAPSAGPAHPVAHFLLRIRTSTRLPRALSPHPSFETRHTSQAGPHAVTQGRGDPTLRGAPPALAASACSSPGSSLPPRCLAPARSHHGHPTGAAEKQELAPVLPPPRTLSWAQPLPRTSCQLQAQSHPYHRRRAGTGGDSIEAALSPFSCPMADSLAGPEAAVMLKSRTQRGDNRRVCRWTSLV